MSGHRGTCLKDHELFASDKIPALRQAVSDLSFLLTRGYAIDSALKLVGDRFQLHKRQRLALRRAACPDQSRENRRIRSCVPEGVKGQHLLVDGFNLLITVEAAFGGAVVFRSRDQCYRDISGVHGSYRSVAETEKALVLLGEVLETLEPASITWLLDRPVSNSGRLSKRMEQLAFEKKWSWNIELPFNPDNVLISSTDFVATSDAGVLDRCGKWINLFQYCLERSLKESWIVDLAPDEEEVPGGGGLIRN